MQCQDDIAAFSTKVGQPLEIDVLSLVGDPHGLINVASLTITSGPLYGTAHLNTTNGQAKIIYTPSAEGPATAMTDLLVYSICDEGAPPYSCCGDPHATVAIYVLNEAMASPSQPATSSVRTS